MAFNSIIYHLQRQAHENPDFIALVYGETSISFRKLFELAMKTGGLLTEKGVKSSDVVALSFRSELLYTLSILGIASLGATSICIPISTPRHQKHLFTKQARCTKFLKDEEHESYSDDPWKIINLADLFTYSGNGFTFIESPGTNLILAIGSGSTGLKKLMPISHQVMIERCDTVLDDPVLKSGGRLLCLSSIAFISVVNRFFNAIHSGTTFILLDSKIDDIFEFIRRNSVSALVLSVFHLEELLRKPRSDSFDYFQKYIKAIRCVGSLFSEDLKKRVFDNLNENVINSYATNETGVISRTTLPAHFDGLSNIGFPLNRVKVEVVDPTDKVLSYGKRGNIRISTPGLINQYLYNELATKKHFRGKWFYPGDIGEFSSDGSLLFHGRSDRMMIFNGINIFPVEIEQTLTSHPLVIDCIAFPIKNLVSQDIPVCAISIKGSSHLSEKDLLQWATERLGISCPRRIFILQTLPKTVEGKVNLFELVEIIRDKFKN